MSDEVPAEEVYAPGVAIPALGPLNDAIPLWGPIHQLAWYACLASSMPPPAFYVGAALPIIAHEAARRGYVYADTGRGLERPRIQSVLVAPGAAGKSSAMRVPMDFYRDFLRETQGGHYRDPFVLTEGSIPGICEVLANRLDYHTGCTPTVLHLEEFSRILGQKDSVSEVLNQLFDGRDYERHLRGYQQDAKNGEKPPSKITAPALSGIFATTFAGLETTNTVMHREGGFFSRMLWFTGKSQDFTLDSVPAHYARTRALGLWTGWSAFLDASELTGRRKVLSIDPKCKPVFNEVVAELNALKRKDDEHPHVPFLMRLLERAQQIAMLYAFSRGDLVANEDDAQRAVALMRTCEGSIQLIRGRWTARSMDGWEQVQQCLAVIEKAGEEGIGRAALGRKLRWSKGQLDFALDTLLDQLSVRAILDTTTRGAVKHFQSTSHPVKVNIRKFD